MLTRLAIFDLFAAFHALAYNAGAAGSNVDSLHCTSSSRFAPTCHVVERCSDALEQSEDGCYYFGASLDARWVWPCCQPLALLDSAAKSQPPSSRWRGGCPGTWALDGDRSGSDCSHGFSSRASDRGRGAHAVQLVWRALTAATARCLSEPAAGGAAATEDAQPRVLPRLRSTMPSSQAASRPPRAPVAASTAATTATATATATNAAAAATNAAATNATAPATEPVRAVRRAARD